MCNVYGCLVEISSSLLIVEDDEPLLNSISRALRDEKYTVVPVTTGKVALELLKEHQFSLILLDITLPDIDGIEILKEMQVMRITTPVIIISSVNELRIALEAKELGAIDFFAKPFDYYQLTTRIHNTLQPVYHPGLIP